MMVNAQEEAGGGSGLHTDSHHTPTDTQPSSSKPQKKIKPKRKQRQAVKDHSPSSEIPVKESIPTPSNDPLPSGEDSIQLNELMIFCTNLQQQLENRKKSRPAWLRRLKKVGSSKQVESFEEKDSLGAQEDASKQGRIIEDIDQDAKIALVDEAQGRMHDVDMFGVDDLEGNEVFIDVREKIVEKEVSTADPVTTAGEVVIAASVEDSVAPTTATTADVDDELTLAKSLIAIKAVKPKVISTAITTPRAKEPKKPLKKKDQISLDEKVARKLEAEMRAEIKEEERILAEQIQAQEREQFSIKERSKLLTELIESKRNFDDIKKIFDKVYKRVNIFVDMDTENVEESLKKTQAEGSSKRAGQELEQESVKKQKLAEQEQAKVADDNTAELKRYLEIVPEDDDDVAIEATPLSSKSSTIVD
uniref:Uncharacterized protein n=1 Tax=Tanacetum cinerariifolium TaxID=118510 RepID=A0A6L2JTG7_TANCI|nr:hypothetical protein [Tanacetum cinerariifolium]